MPRAFRAEAVTRIFVLGEASRLRSLFNELVFADIETHTVRHTFVLMMGASGALRQKPSTNSRCRSGT